MRQIPRAYAPFLMNLLTEASRASERAGRYKQSKRFTLEKECLQYKWKLLGKYCESPNISERLRGLRFKFGSSSSELRGIHERNLAEISKLGVFGTGCWGSTPVDPGGVEQQADAAEVVADTQSGADTPLEKLPSGGREDLMPGSAAEVSPPPRWFCGSC